MRTGMILLAAFGPLLFSNFGSAQDETQILSGRLVEGESVKLKLVPPEGTRSIIVVASFETPRQFGTNGAWDVQRKTQVLFRGTPQSDTDTGVLFEQSVLVPWLDCTAVTLWAKHFGSDGKLLGAMRIGNFSFQPRCIEKAVKWQNDEGKLREYERAVVVCRTHQRGYVLDSERVPIFSFLVATGRGGATPLFEPGSSVTLRRHKVKIGIVGKYLGTPTSQKFGVPLYDALPLDEKAILLLHGTDPKNYRLLGKEASHGCVRTHQEDQKSVVALLKNFLKEGVPAW